MKTVYLLYGFFDKIDEDGKASPESVLLAIYDSRDKAKAAIFDWERKTSQFDSFDIMNWQVQ